jgi:gamma-glutamyl hercynylcysteine S-oxide synthase
MEAVRERTRANLGDVSPFIAEMLVQHEHQHNETMLQTLQLAEPGVYAPERERPAGAAASGSVDFEAGTAEIGFDGDGFAYDNERPRHAVELPAFRIARRPVTNGTWMHFCEGGGYERREWWSDEGWAWKEEYDITHPEGWTAGGPSDDDHRPALHVSWFEADAFARAHGARLPTEAEWEKAATWTQEPLQEVGEAWEWTSSHFRAYPGFVAHPYREYSEVFFGDGYRVLRGGSWATDPRVATATFRNWDLPQRRQIFAGVRLAEEA